MILLWQSYVQDKQLYSTANLLAVPEGFIDWQTFGSSEIKPIRELNEGSPIFMLSQASQNRLNILIIK